MAGWRWQIQHFDYPISETIGQPRRVTVAIPSGADMETATVVYCTDGQVVESLAVNFLRSSNSLHPPILIGVHSHPEIRAEEYLLSSKEQYLSHEKFFTDDLRFWAHKVFGISVGRENSVLFGFSNGGAFAIATTLRHCDRFAAAIAFSVPAFGQLREVPQLPDSRPSVYLAAGNRGAEKSIRKNVLQLFKTLQRNRILVEYCERMSDHTLDFWVTEFVTAVHWFEQKIKRQRDRNHEIGTGPDI